MYKRIESTLEFFIFANNLEFWMTGPSPVLSFRPISRRPTRSSDLDLLFLFFLLNVLNHQPFWK
jgi:hypothetical protein